MTTVDPNFSERRRPRGPPRPSLHPHQRRRQMVPGSRPELDHSRAQGHGRRQPRAQMKELWRLLGVPLLAIAPSSFSGARWRRKVQTSLGAVPGPAAVWEEAVNLHDDAQAKAAKPRKIMRPWSPSATRSSSTRASPKGQGCRLHRRAELLPTDLDLDQNGLLRLPDRHGVAIPLGIMAGLSPTANAALNPLDPDLQTGLAAGLAADRDDGRLGCLRHQ